MWNWVPSQRRSGPKRRAWYWGALRGAFYPPRRLSVGDGVGSKIINMRINTAPLIFVGLPPKYAAVLIANFNSLVLDFVARTKIGGTYLTFGYLNQFAVLPPTHYRSSDFDFLLPRIKNNKGSVSLDRDALFDVIRRSRDSSSNADLNEAAAAADASACG